MSFANPVKLAARRAQGALTARGGRQCRWPIAAQRLLPGATAWESANGPTSVSLGGLGPYRYSGIRVHGIGGVVTVYAVPTSAGVATIACIAPPTAPAAAATDCAEVAATLRVVGARAYPLGPTSDYARQLSSTFTKLRSAVAAAATRLRAARTRSGQADAGRGLAAAYSAASAAAGPAVSPRDSDASAALVAALRVLADGYTALARAAGAGDSGAYGRAQRQVAAGASSLRSALAALAALGYAVGGSQ